MKYGEKSPALKGAYRRELSKTGAEFRKRVPWECVEESASRGSPVEFTEGVCVSARKYEHVDIFKPRYTIQIYDIFRNPVDFWGLPSLFEMYDEGNPTSVSWYNKHSKAHREGKPALISTIIKKYKVVIKEIAYKHLGEYHNFAGPAKIYLDEHVLRYKWFIYGKEVSQGDLKKIVKNPFSIGKKEQMYLKLLMPSER